MEMERAGKSELERVIEVYTAAIASLCYCYYLVWYIPKGFARLIFIIPVIALFTLLPFHLKTFHLGGITAFFLLWLANFKLVLFAFDLGPLMSSSSSSSQQPLPKPIIQFLTTACFPISLSHQQTKNNKSSTKSSLLIKIILLSSFIYLTQFDYKRILHPHLLLFLYCIFVYLAAETSLALSILPIKLFLGPHSHFDPQFNEPYLSTSLQDFWGRRWNLMVPAILRPSVYNPIRLALTPIVGHNSASFAATVAAFIVSGLMHEIIWFYFTRVNPTWEVTAFFTLHGVCTATEAAMKRSAVLGNRLRLPPAVSTPLTLGFIALTANWLFFPQILRNRVDEFAIREYAPLVHAANKTIHWFKFIAIPASH